MFVRFHVFGSQGWVQARSDTHPSQDGVTRLSFSQTGQAIQTQDFAYRDTVLENLEAFASAIADKTDYPFTYEEKLGNVSTMEAIIESAQTGRSVAVK
jgi:predicted dehydrogenase